MSSSDDVDVMQKKTAKTSVIWREYEALRDHLTRTFTSQTEVLDTEVQNVQLQLGETDNTVKDIQTQMTTMQASLTTLTQSVNAIRLALEQPRQDD